MHTLDPSPPNLRRALIIGSIVAAALIFVVLGADLDDFAAAASRAQSLHVPDLALFAAQPPAVQIHVLAALGAVGLGAALMVRRKGRRFHRAAGWTWTVLICAVAFYGSLLLSGALAFLPGRLLWRMFFA